MHIFKTDSVQARALRAGLYNFEKPSGPEVTGPGWASWHTASEVGRLAHTQRFCGQHPSLRGRPAFFPPS